jgi:hypothetical protein
MERAKFRIFTHAPPPKIIAQTTLEAESHSPINTAVAVAAPLGHSRHLDVDGILARSLPKVTESFKKAA